MNETTPPRNLVRWLSAVSRRCVWPTVLTAMAMSFAPTARADWPMARQNPRRTGVASGTSSIETPTPYWKAYMGGAIFPQSFLALDLTGSGVLNPILVTSGRVVAFDAATTNVIWETERIQAQRFVGAADLDGDGRQEIVVAARQQIAVLSDTGDVLWQQPLGEIGTLGGTRLEDLNGDGLPEVVAIECGCCSVNSGRAGFVWSFADGGSVSAPRLLWELPELQCGGARSATIVRMRTMNQAELLHGTPTTLQLLDGATGAVVAVSEELGPIAQATRCLPVPNAPNVGSEDVVCVKSDTGSGAGLGHRVFRLHRNGAVLEIVWDLSVGDQDGAVGWVGSGLVDLDGDGSLEAVVSARVGADTPVLAALDLNAGVIAAVKMDVTAHGFVGDGSGAAVVIASSDDELLALRLVGGQLATSWVLPNGKALLTANFERAQTSDISSDVVATDVDGDGRVELIAQVKKQGSGANLVAIDVATGPALKRIYETPAGVAPATGWSVGSSLFVGQNDGNLHMIKELDSQTWTVATGNPEYGIPYGNYYAPAQFRLLHLTPVVGDLGDGIPGVIAQTSSGTVRRLDARTATFAAGPSTIWEIEQARGAIIVDGLAGGAPGLAMIFRESLDSEAIMANDANGQQLWRTPLQGVVLTDLVYGNANGDGIPDIYVQWGDRTDSIERNTVLSGADGSILWDAPPSPPHNRQPAGIAVADWNGDGFDDLIHQRDKTEVLDGRTGAVLAESPVLFTYYQPMVINLDDDPEDELILQGSFANIIALDHDFSLLWEGEVGERPLSYATVARCEGRPGQLVSGSWQFQGRLKLTEIAGPNAGASETRVFADGEIFIDEAAAEAAGKLQGLLSSPVIHQNFVGDGQDRILFGSTDGWVYVVDPCSLELSTALYFGADVGSLIFGDTDGDGQDEVLASVADGFLYDLRNGTVPAVESVIDTDPPRGIVDTDVDEIETIDTLYAAWPRVVGAQGYEVSVVRDPVEGGGMITDGWVDVGNVAEIALPKLDLVDGSRYLFAVRAYIGTTRSPDRLSDGVRVKLLEKIVPDPEPVWLNGRSCVYFCSAAPRSASPEGVWWALALAMAGVLRRRGRTD